MTMSNEECCVCYEETAKDDFKVLRPCKHQICGKCMKEYTTRSIKTCPMCRLDFDLLEHLSEDKGYLNMFGDPRVTPLPSISVSRMISMNQVHVREGIAVEEVSIPMLHPSPLEMVSTGQELIRINGPTLLLPVWREEISLRFSNERSI